MPTPLAAEVVTAASQSTDGSGAIPTYLALVMLLAVVCQWVAWAIRIPSLLLLLVAGFALGQWHTADDVLGRDLLFAGASIAVGIILFEGSLSLKFSELRGISGPVVRLCSVVVAIAWVLLSLAAVFVGIDWRLAILVGAILVVTGPTVINPILRQLRPNRRVSSLLRWEGIVVDPIGAILAVLVFQAILAGREGDTLAVIAGGLLLTLGVAVAIAVPLAFVMGFVVRRHWVPDYLQGVLFIGVAVASLVLSNELASESGLLTVTILGIALANQRQLEMNHIQEFSEHLQVLFVGVLFIVLAGRVSVDDVTDIAPQALAFVALAVLIVRPVSIWLGLAGTAATRQERMLLAFMAPRGIVAAAVTSIFALEFLHSAETMQASADGAADSAEAEALSTKADALATLGEQAQQLVPLVFVLIVCTVAIYGLGVGRLAERLGLAASSPQGVLFAGASSWVVEAAAHLKEHDIPTVIVDDNFRSLSAARMEGLTTVTTNILSEFAVEELELGGVGHFIGATDVDSTNSTAAREFAHILGRTGAWQLRRHDDDHEDHHHKRPAQHLIARYPFSPSVTFEEMVERSESGHAVRKTNLTDSYSYQQFREQYPDAVVMFTIRDGRLQVFTEDSAEPSAGTTVLSLRPEAEQHD